MKRVCVYCGSRPGARADYLEAAAELGRAMAARGIGLVFGGGRVGLMGGIAQAALDAGGEVIGVIPEDLVRRELAHTGVTELHVVRSMHERKAVMVDLSDAFVAMPGGIGTLDELFEVMTWAQLEMHHKPFGLLNVAGYFDPLNLVLDRMVAESFLHPEHRAALLCASEPAALLDALAAHAPKRVDKAGWALERG